MYTRASIGLCECRVTTLPTRIYFVFSPSHIMFFPAFENDPRNFKSIWKHTANDNTLINDNIITVYISYVFINHRHGSTSSCTMFVRNIVNTRQQTAVPNQEAVVYTL